MPRHARQAPGGLVYHVLNRSVAGIKIFRRIGDYEAFEKTLIEAHQRLAVPILAYCIMPNHWHLVLRPERDGELSDFMYWLTLTHVQRWRASHNTIGFGPLYQGRFKSFAIQEDEHLLTVLRYVERNPVRANLIPKAQEWRWSSLFRRTCGTPDERALLSSWPVDGPPDWVGWVNAAQTAAEEEALQQSIYRSRPFGHPAWQRSTAARLGLSSCFRPEGRPWPSKSERK
jgi:putative transposase